MANRLFDKDGNPLYRIHTGCKRPNIGVFEPFRLYLHEEEPQFADLLRKEKTGELGEVSRGQRAVAGAQHTAEMLADSQVVEGDEDGLVDTTDREIAKKVIWFGFLKAWATKPSKKTKNSLVTLDELRDKVKPLLDKGSPQDIIDELMEQVEVARDPRKLQAKLKKAKEMAPKATAK